MNFLELLDHFDIPYRTEGEHEHARPGWAQIDCPECNEQDHFRLGVNLQYLYAHCWLCGYVKLEHALHELTHEPYGKVYELLKVARGDLALPTEVLKPRGKLKLPNGLGPLLPVHERYLKSRGFDPTELVKLWGIQGIGLAARLPWRLFIPIHLHGKVVSWTTRALVDDIKLRYITAKKTEEAVPAKEVLFGEDLVGLAVIVVEGPFDAFRIGPGAVATLGTSYTTAQLLKLSKYPVRVICLDSEENAQRRAKKLCEALSVFPGTTANVCLDAKDPGAAGQKEIELLRRSYLR